MRLIEFAFESRIFFDLPALISEGTIRRPKTVTNKQTFPLETSGNISANISKAFFFGRENKIEKTFLGENLMESGA